MKLKNFHRSNKTITWIYSKSHMKELFPFLTQKNFCSLLLFYHVQSWHFKDTIFSSSSNSINMGLAVIGQHLVTFSKENLICMLKATKAHSDQTDSLWRRRHVTHIKNTNMKNLMTYSCDQYGHGDEVYIVFSLPYWLTIGFSWLFRWAHSSSRLWPHFLLLNAFDKFFTATGLINGRCQRRKRKNSTFIDGLSIRPKWSPSENLTRSTVFIQECCLQIIYLLINVGNLFAKLLLLCMEWAQSVLRTITKCRLSLLLHCNSEINCSREETSLFRRSPPRQTRFLLIRNVLKWKHKATRNSYGFTGAFSRYLKEKNGHWPPPRPFIWFAMAPALNKLIYCTCSPGIHIVISW